MTYLGDEAIAQAALDAGISGVYAYPGTPSTEITEYIQQHCGEDVHSRWCTNEKTAMEAALGMSYAGRRALVCMKHVGLNVAADCFINSAITGVNGGLVVVSADDPSQHSSQDEQDSRFYGDFSFVPMLEPSNQQEAYDMMRYAFELSEQTGEPVLFRITTRLAHSRSGVKTTAPLQQKPLSPNTDPQQFILLPAIARRRYAALLEKQTQLLTISEASPCNSLKEGGSEIGVIAFGIGYNYVMEILGADNTHTILKVGQYPMPLAQIRKVIDNCTQVLIVEDGQPFAERLIRGCLDAQAGKIHGRLDGTLPRTGELDPNNAQTGLQRIGAVNISSAATLAAVPDIVVPRPPALCEGCGHRDMYAILTEVLRAEYPAPHVFGDIGCYTLGAGIPYRAINSCVDMGASITMAKGAADAGIYPAVAVIGDSTFTHSGMTGLLDCVNEDANVTIIISDNETTAMTGGQDSAGTGRIESICIGLGVKPEHVRTVVPLKKNYEEMRTILRQELNHKGTSVIIPRRECVQVLKRSRHAPANNT